MSSNNETKPRTVTITIRSNPKHPEILRQQRFKQQKKQRQQQQLSYNVSNIPRFMLDYFDWHKEQLDELHLQWNRLSRKKQQRRQSLENVLLTSNHTILILRCIHGDRCGGTSDRLKAFPLFLLLAQQSSRILFIRWGKHRPFPIEEFLYPNLWNWTVPEPLLHVLEGDEEEETEYFHSAASLQKYHGNATVTNNDHNIINNNHHNNNNMTMIGKYRVYFDGTKFKQLRQNVMDPSVYIVEGNDYSGGAHRYRRLVTFELARQQKQKGQQNKKNEDVVWKPQDADYTNFYHDLFHASFRPSPAIQNILNSYLVLEAQNTSSSSRISRRSSPYPSPTIPQSTRLYPNQYMVTQYRAKYPNEPYRETWNVSILEQTALYAIQCAQQRRGRVKYQPQEREVIYMASDTALALQAVHRAYPPLDNDDSTESTTAVVWTSLSLPSTLITNSLSFGNNASNTNASNPKDMVVAAAVAVSNVPLFAVDPPHLNFAKLDDPSGFYNIFVDLFLMSYSYCVVFGAGGFGRFGSLVSYHPQCGMAFTKNGGILQPCPRYEEE